MRDNSVLKQYKSSFVHPASYWQSGELSVFLDRHEIIGVVTDVGSKATEYKAGDIVGVGVYIWACQNCDACHKGSQSYCNQVIMTYNTVDRDQRVAQGGYSTHIVTHQDFVFRIPTNLDLSACAPLLCAGITVWSPLMHFNLNKPGLKVSSGSLCLGKMF